MSEIFFNLDGQPLYLEQMLETYEGMPLFFICRRLEERYLVLCVDFEGEEYFAVKIGIRRLKELLFGEITMQEVFQRSDGYWDIVCGEDQSGDLVRKKEISAIPEDLLPYKGAYFALVRQDQRDYAEAIKRAVADTKWSVMDIAIPSDAGVYSEIIEDMPLRVRLLCRKYDIDMSGWDNAAIVISKEMLLAA